MDLSDLISPEAIRTLSAVSSKKRIFQEVGEMAEASYGLPAHATVEALIARESLGPTGVGHGVALPHARLPTVEAVKGLFVKLDKPIDFGASDRLPVDLIFVLLAPEAAGVEHLKALALVSRTLRDTDIRGKLRANDEPLTLHTVLTEGPLSTKAA